MKLHNKPVFDPYRAPCWLVKGPSKLMKLIREDGYQYIRRHIPSAKMIVIAHDDWPKFLGWALADDDIDSCSKCSQGVCDVWNPEQLTLLDYIPREPAETKSRVPPRDPVYEALKIGAQSFNSALFEFFRNVMGSEPPPRFGKGARQTSTNGSSSGSDTGVMDLKEASAILGIKLPASEAEIQAAFRKLALKAHPDHGGSADAMRRLIQARDTALKTGVRAT